MQQSNTPSIKLNPFIASSSVIMPSLSAATPGGLSGPLVNRVSETTKNNNHQHLGDASSKSNFSKAYQQNMAQV